MISPIYDQIHDSEPLEQYSEALEQWFHEEVPSLTPEDEAVIALEEMRRDASVHLTTSVLTWLSCDRVTVEPDMVHIILPHLVRCTRCVFVLRQTLRLCNAPEDHPAYGLLTRTREEIALRSNAEGMRLDRSAHAHPDLLRQYAEGGLPEECVPVVLRHLWTCEGCRESLMRILELKGMTGQNEAYRQLSEIRQRLQQVAESGVLISGARGRYIVSFRPRGEMAYREKVASLPAFARYQPRVGERVLLWEQGDGHILLGESWDPVRSAEILETTAPELSRQERLEPDFPYNREQTEVLLKHASKW